MPARELKELSSRLMRALAGFLMAAIGPSRYMHSPHAYTYRALFAAKRSNLDGIGEKIARSPAGEVNTRREPLHSPFDWQLRSLSPLNRIGLPNAPDAE